MVGYELRGEWMAQFQRYCEYSLFPPKNGHTQRVRREHGLCLPLHLLLPQPRTALLPHTQDLGCCAASESYKMNLLYSHCGTSFAAAAIPIFHHSLLPTLNSSEI